MAVKWSFFWRSFKFEILKGVCGITSYWWAYCSYWISHKIHLCKNQFAVEGNFKRSFLRIWTKNQENPTENWVEEISQLGTLNHFQVQFCEFSAIHQGWNWLLLWFQVCRMPWVGRKEWLGAEESEKNNIHFGDFFHVCWQEKCGATFFLTINHGELDVLCGARGEFESIRCKMEVQKTFSCLKLFMRLEVFFRSMRWSWK